MIITDLVLEVNVMSKSKVIPGTGLLLIKKNTTTNNPSKYKNRIYSRFEETRGFFPRASKNLEETRTESDLIL